MLHDEGGKAVCTVGYRTAWLRHTCREAEHLKAPHHHGYIAALCLCKKVGFLLARGDEDGCATAVCHVACSTLRSLGLRNLGLSLARLYTQA